MNRIVDSQVLLIGFMDVIESRLDLPNYKKSSIQFILFLLE